MTKESPLPKISIVTPSYNQGEFIERTIDSVLSQNYPDLEYIIIDGGSKDNTIEIIKKYEKYLTYWISKPDNGQSHAINKGFNICTGKILNWLNSDDWFTNDALHIVSSEFIANPWAGLIVGQGDAVNLQGEVIHTFKPSEINHTTLLKWIDGTWFLQPACFFRKEIFDNCGPINEEEDIAFDLEFWLKTSESGYKFKVIQHTLAQALFHNKAKTTENAWRAYIQMAHIIECHGGKGEIIRQGLKINRHINELNMKLDWYKNNYLKVTRNPYVRFIRPLVKLIARNESGYWPSSIPPWLR